MILVFDVLYFDQIRAPMIHKIFYAEVINCLKQQQDVKEVDGSANTLAPSKVSNDQLTSEKALIPEIAKQNAKEGEGSHIASDSTPKLEIPTASAETFVRELAKSVSSTTEAKPIIR